ncbi:MAG: twin-arginine translocase TatA/TatE family subunit [Sphingomicrobium sp.]
MGSFGLIHWVIVAVLLLLLFGGSRFSSMMGDVAKGLKSFKQGMADEDDKKSLPSSQAPPQQQPIDITARPADPAPLPQTPPPPVPPADDKPL